MSWYHIALALVEILFFAEEKGVRMPRIVVVDLCCDELSLYSSPGLQNVLQIRNAKFACEKMIFVYISKNAAKYCVCIACKNL